MKTLLTLSAFLFVVAGIVGAGDFIIMVHNGQIDEIYADDHHVPEDEESNDLEELASLTAEHDVLFADLKKDENVPLDEEEPPLYEMYSRAAMWEFDPDEAAVEDYEFDHDLEREPIVTSEELQMITSVELTANVDDAPAMYQVYKPSLDEHKKKSKKESKKEGKLLVKSFIKDAKFSPAMFSRGSMVDYSYMLELDSLETALWEGITDTFSYDEEIVIKSEVAKEQ